MHSNGTTFDLKLHASLFAGGIDNFLLLLEKNP